MSPFSSTCPRSAPDRKLLQVVGIREGGRDGRWSGGAGQPSCAGRDGEVLAVRSGLIPAAECVGLEGRSIIWCHAPSTTKVGEHEGS